MNHLEKVKLAVEYVETHLTQKLDLERLARAVNYSKYHLHRSFRKTLGITIHTYAKRRQLTEAAKLLVFSNKAILDIALLAGYESQQAFTSAFTALYKHSPKEFREREVFYPLQLKYEFEDDVHRSRLNASGDELPARIRLAQPEDIPGMMELTRQVVSGFPYLDETAHAQTIGLYIQQRRALVLKDDALAVGMMLYSPDTGSIDFLGTHPLYRRLGIAKAFLDKLVKELLPENKVISTTSFREGDKADTGHREALTELGFAEAELLIEYGYPTQRFILRDKGGRINE